MTLEKKLESLLPPGDGPFNVIAFELQGDGGGSWCVNTPFRIGTSLDRAGAINRLRSRWNIFKLNYAPKARVAGLSDISDGFDGACNLECDGIAFADVETAERGEA